MGQMGKDSGECRDVSSPQMSVSTLSTLSTEQAEENWRGIHQDTL